MFEVVFEKASDSLLAVLLDATEECARMNNRWICTEHLLLALTHDASNVAGQALTSMQISSESVQKEVDEALQDQTGWEPLFEHFSDPLTEKEAPGLKVKPIGSSEGAIDETRYSQQTVEALKRSLDYSLFFGEREIQPQHLLLSLLDNNDGGVSKIFEELAINTPFLRRQVMAMHARESYKGSSILSLREALITGFNEMVGRYQQYVQGLIFLAARAGGLQIGTPMRSQVVHMVCLAYMGDFLNTQVAFQRYLLEENIRSVSKRVGGLDKEITASIVSSGAQNLRAEVRATIEYIWCNQYRLLTRLLDDAEHDLIGSVIEDLWWAQSEEIALHDLFAEAMDDHRRKQVLTLQKRRTEIAQRLTKLGHRLDDTVKQCFVKHSKSA
ncbi:MAG TPA: Clp protease N-terminal domain-containing protein [Planktothrix sp.]|jgi:hypothetical protein